MPRNGPRNSCVGYLHHHLKVCARKKQRILRIVKEEKERELRVISFPEPVGNVPFRGEGEEDVTTRTTTSSNNHGQDDPTYILAKSYFDLGEYRRCADLLA